MTSATDGLPWPVVLMLAVATLALLYAVACLAAHFHHEDEENPQ